MSHTLDGSGAPDNGSHGRRGRTGESHFPRTRAGVTNMRVLVIYGIGLTMVAAAPGIASGQACHGTPRGTSIAYEYGKLNVGNTQGLAATFGGITLGGRLRDINEDVSGYEADLRFSLVLGTSRFQVCPLIGLGFQRDDWDFDVDSKLTTNMLTAKAGVAIGTEIPVSRGFTAIPFLQVAYQFSAIHFDLEIPNSEPEVTGDTVSVVDIGYGLVGRYKNFFAGVAANRDTDTEGIRPYQARWILGFSFSGGNKSSPAPASRRRSDEKRR